MFDIKIKNVDGKNLVFDPLRKKFVVLTPEEWVRQHFVHLLINKYKYPKSLIKLESGLKYNKLSKRTDIVVYDRNGDTFLVVECKAAHILLNQETLKQVTTYNLTMKAKYIAVTNGLQHFCCAIDHKEKACTFLNDLPVL